MRCLLPRVAGATLKILFFYLLQPAMPGSNNQIKPVLTGPRIGETGTGMEEAIFLYDRFSIVAFLILALAVPAVFWLAVFKPKGEKLPN